MRMKWPAAIMLMGMLLLIAGQSANASAGVVKETSAGASVSARIVEGEIPAAALTSEVWSCNLQTKDSSIIVRQGVTYISQSQLAAMLRDLVWRVGTPSGSIQVSGPNHTLSLSMGSRYAVMNGVKRKMSGASFVQNGVQYLPLRDVVSWAGGTVNVDAQGKLTIAYTVRSMVIAGDSGTYWVRRDNGIVYTAAGSEMPHQIGRSKVRAGDQYSIRITELAENSTLLSINHNYGSPTLKLNNDEYRLIVYRGMLVRESFVHYLGVQPIQYAEAGGGIAAMMNGTELQLVQPNGRLTARIDLLKLVNEQLTVDKPGYSFDKAFTLEYVSVEERIALVKPYSTYDMLLVDMNAGTVTELYKELLPQDEVEMMNRWKTEPTDFKYQGDRIAFERRDGNVLIFSHETLHDSIPYTEDRITELRYTLQLS
ncbi:hypothetical protein H8B09_20460 [Paenibacillus sp. PR3]|uniref:Copper amine oxidase-like N-terminal domain-containing protein n=1 Tax=Paenibacillus terricola TaxID=2763503 RepID=A0ABR8MYY7_9BACL|nr:stalk domain-containing protein [Paenibacillus terricola]MBD3921152.1 hypothetical protein [Paenibacillus terricola]